MKALYLLLLLFLLAEPASAQKLANPFILPSGKQRITILEFETPGTAPFGRTLARLLQHQIAREVVPGNGTAFVPTRNPDERISEKPENINLIAGRERAFFMLWGEFYQEEDGIYMYPYLRVIPQSGFPLHGFGLTYSTGESELTASLPSNQINFAPISFTMASLTALNDALNDPVTLRLNPEETSPEVGRLLSTDDYVLQESKGEWQKVVVANAITGWMKPAVEIASRDSVALLPLVLFIKGLSLYASGEHAASGEAFALFLNRFKAAEDQLTVATAHILNGNTMLRTERNRSQQARDDATAEYQTASKLLPDNPSPVDHLTIVRLVKLGPNPAERTQEQIAEIRDSEIRIIDMIQRDPNPQSVNNLQVFYRMAAKYDLLRGSDLSQGDYVEQIESQIDLLNQIRTQELRIIIVRPTPNIQSIRVGLWTPADRERAFPYDSVFYQRPEVSNSQTSTFGVDFEHRARMLKNLFFDFSVGIWYSSYSSKRVNQNPQVPYKEADAWNIVAPFSVGLSFTLLDHTVLQPFVMGGVGVTGALSNYNVLLLDDSREKESKIQFVFSGFIGAGTDIFVSEGFGFSLGLKYHIVSFNEEMFTGQKNLSGIQVGFGISTRI